MVTNIIHRSEVTPRPRVDRVYTSTTTDLLYLEKEDISVTIYSLQLDGKKMKWSQRRGSVSGAGYRSVAPNAGRQVYSDTLNEDGKTAGGWKTKGFPWVLLSPWFSFETSYRTSRQRRGSCSSEGFWNPLNAYQRSAVAVGNGQWSRGNRLINKTVG